MPLASKRKLRKLNCKLTQPFKGAVAIQFDTQRQMLQVMTRYEILDSYKAKLKLNPAWSRRLLGRKLDAYWKEHYEWTHIQGMAVKGNHFDDTFASARLTSHDRALRRLFLRHGITSLKGQTVIATFTRLHKGIYKHELTHFLCNKYSVYKQGMASIIAKYNVTLLKEKLRALMYPEANLVEEVNAFFVCTGKVACLKDLGLSSDEIKKYSKRFARLHKELTIHHRNFVSTYATQ